MQLDGLWASGNTVKASDARKTAHTVKYKPPYLSEEKSFFFLLTVANSLYGT